MCVQIVGKVPDIPHVQKQAQYVALSRVFAKWYIEYSNEL
jgi:hypothetical protein